MKYLIVALLAYLIGNITGSYIISKSFFAEDIREKGSGNAGTTNMLRIYGLLPGIITLLIDMAKGYLAVYLGALIEPQYGSYIAGLFVVIGHIWPVVLKFKGGKGMATSAGVYLYHTPWMLLIALVLFFIINFIGKIMSLTSLILATFATVYILIFHNNDYYLMGLTISLAILVFYSHRSNIKRLKEGSENKISIKK